MIDALSLQRIYCRKNGYLNPVADQFIVVIAKCARRKAVRALVICYGHKHWLLIRKGPAVCIFIGSITDMDRPVCPNTGRSKGKRSASKGHKAGK